MLVQATSINPIDKSQDQQFAIKRYSVRSNGGLPSPGSLGQKEFDRKQEIEQQMANYKASGARNEAIQSKAAKFLQHSLHIKHPLSKKLVVNRSISRESLVQHKTVEQGLNPVVNAKSSQFHNEA